MASNLFRIFRARSSLFRPIWTEPRARQRNLFASGAANAPKHARGIDCCDLAHSRNHQHRLESRHTQQRARLTLRAPAEHRSVHVLSDQPDIPTISRPIAAEGAYDADLTNLKRPGR